MLAKDMFHTKDTFHQDTFQVGELGRTGEYAQLLLALGRAQNDGGKLARTHRDVNALHLIPPEC